MVYRIVHFMFVKYTVEKTDEKGNFIRLGFLHIFMFLFIQSTGVHQVKPIYNPMPF